MPLAPRHRLCIGLACAGALCVGLPALAWSTLRADPAPGQPPVPLSASPAHDPATLRLRLFGRDYGSVHLDLLDENYYHGGFRHWLRNGLGNVWQALTTREDRRHLPSYREEFSDAPAVAPPPERNVPP
ncbi:hypothetical protein WG628_12105 [Stenotrophomonas maltophilia]